MNIELVMLGTGHAMVTNCYNTCFALKNGDDFFLVDAGGGNGIMVQLDKAKIPYQAIHHMFVTHGHTDHILGVIWVIRKIAMLMAKNKYKGELVIYCHDQVVNMLKTFCQLTLPKNIEKFIGNGIILREVVEGERIKAIGIDFQFFDIASTKAKQFGFHADLPNAKTLVCLGDEPYNSLKVSKEYVKQCDWLLSEAYCLYSDKDIFNPYEKHHSTALDAGKLAESFSAKNLVLYHTEDTNLAERKIRYQDEAKTVFSGRVFVPNDLECIRL